MRRKCGRGFAHLDCSGTLISTPLLDEIEVSLFGPGKGESVVIHLGDGRWMVVDSCTDQRAGSIPPLDYLLALGVNVATQVDLVVATHAHNDHFAGISKIYEASRQAKFVLPAAATTEEFAAFVALDETLQGTLRQSAYSEYRAVMDVADSRQSASKGLRQLKFAVQDRMLLSRAPTATCPAITVRALSPSDEAFNRAQTSHAARSYEVDAPRRVLDIDPNLLAVALWIECGERAILLGADLLNGPAGCGWGAVLGSFSPARTASLFKVPHHGSPTSHHDRVWATLLGEDPVAVVTPYRGSQTSRPSPEDVTRIRGLTKHVYATASTRLPARARNATSAASSLQGLASNVRDVWGSVGQVRCRLRAGVDDWSVELNSPALAL